MVLQEGIDRFVRSANGAGMRARQLATRLRAPELVGDDRFAGVKRPTRCRREPLRITQCFQKKQNRRRVGIIDEQLGDFADAQIRLIADRNQL